MKEDKRRIIAALVEKTGVKIDENDPAFIIVVLNQIMLENSASDAAKLIERAAEKFTDAAVTQADDFIAVANEALAKFSAKTNELKAALDDLSARQVAQSFVSPVNSPRSAVPVPAPRARNRNDAIWFVIAFIAGAVFGVGLTLIV
jgi:hypothetical protein